MCISAVEKKIGSGTEITSTRIFGGQNLMELVGIFGSSTWTRRLSLVPGRLQEVCLRNGHAEETAQRAVYKFYIFDGRAARCSLASRQRKATEKTKKQKNHDLAGIPAPALEQVREYLAVHGTLGCRPQKKDTKICLKNNICIAALIVISDFDPHPTPTEFLLSPKPSNRPTNTKNNKIIAKNSVKILSKPRPSPQQQKKNGRSRSTDFSSISSL